MKKDFLIYVVHVYSHQLKVVSLLVCSSVDAGAKLPQAQHHDDHDRSKVCL